jgi:hemolysin activation/secretion protein
MRGIARVVGALLLACTTAAGANTILFRGNRAITFEELAEVARPYTGRQLTPDEIEELRRRLTRLYVDRGYVNSGALVAPETREGVLVFEIVEGRLGAVRLRGLEDLDDKYVTDRLVTDPDAAFNMDALRERFQLLLNDPLFARMNGRLMPGARPGESILDVDIVRAAPHSLTFYANDYRPESIGAEAAGLRGWVRNITGRGDVLEGSVEGPNDNRLLSRGTVAWRFPLGARAPLVFASYDHGRTSVVQEPLAAVDIRSTLQSAEVGLSQVLRETLRERWVVSASHQWRRNKTTLLGVPFSFIPGEPDGVTRTRSWRAWVEGAHRTEEQAVGVRLMGSFVDTNVSDEGFLSVPIPDRSYAVWLGQGQYLRQLSQGTYAVSARATLQYSKSYVLPLDALPIGGVASVRGYLENQFIRQNAAIFSVELERTVVRDHGDGRHLSIAPFVDYGRGSGGIAPKVSLSSAGIAVRGRWNRFAANLAIAGKLSHPPLGYTPRRGLQGHGIHLEISYRLL